MRYDPDGRCLVIDDDRVLPVKQYDRESEPYPSGEATTTERRRVVAYFENTWGLSIIWGSMTYSSNHDHPVDYSYAKYSEPGGTVYPAFIEEPFQVEVAILSPVPFKIPAVHIPAEMSYNNEEVNLPERATDIWGDVMGYVNAEQMRFIVNEVSTFPSEGLDKPPQGPFVVLGPNGWVWSFSYDDEPEEFSPALTLAKRLKEWWHLYPADHD